MDWQMPDFTPWEKFMSPSQKETHSILQGMMNQKGFTDNLENRKLIDDWYKTVSTPTSATDPRWDYIESQKKATTQFKESHPMTREELETKGISQLMAEKLAKGVPRGAYSENSFEKTFNPVDIPSNGTPQGAIGAYKQHVLDQADAARANEANEARFMVGIPNRALYKFMLEAALDRVANNGFIDIDDEDERKFMTDWIKQERDSIAPQALNDIGAKKTRTSDNRPLDERAIEGKTFANLRTGGPTQQIPLTDSSVPSVNVDGAPKVDYGSKETDDDSESE